MQNREARRLPKLLASVIALGMLPWVAQVLACSTDAVGVDACRTIETARCKLAPTCAAVKGSPKIKTTTQVDNCVSYYHDHCLVGLENAKAGDPAKSAIDGCVSALTQTIACQKAGEETMASCDGVDVDDSTMTPCAVFSAPEHLTACKFVASTTTTSTTTTGGGGGSGGSGGSGGGG